MPEIYLNNILKEFIQDNEKKTCLIKGEWGIGKTFFWSKFLKNNTDFISKEIKSYSYVSLFGVKEISDIKDKIIYNAIGKDRLHLDPNNTYFKFFWKEIKKRSWSDRWKFIKNEYPLQRIWLSVKKLVYWFLHLPGLLKKVFGARPPKYFLIKNQLICFDDIERMGSGLSIKALMGLADELVSQRNCKIIFISNEGQLLDLNKKEFQNYREKVIDMEISYIPSVKENFRNIFANFDLESKWGDITFRRCIELKISNMRILKIIKNAVKDYVLEFEKEDLPDEIIKDFLLTLISLIKMYLDKFDEVYDTVKEKYFNKEIDFSEKIYRNTVLGKGTSAIDKKEKTSLTEEDEYDLFLKLTEQCDKNKKSIFDEEIIFYIKNGFVSEQFKKFTDEGKKQLKVLQASERAMFYRNKINSIWDVFYSSFKENESEIIDCIEDLLNDDDLYNFVTILDFNNLLRNKCFFYEVVGKAIDEADLRSHIKKYIQLNREQIMKTPADILDIQLMTDTEGRARLIYEIMMDEIGELERDEKTRRTSLEIVEPFYWRDAWTKRERDLLGSLTKEDYVELCEIDDFRLLRKIHTTRKIMKSYQDMENNVKILDGVLDEISKTTRLNKKRVEIIKQ